MAPTYLITAASGHIGQRLVPLLLSQPSKPSLVLPTANPERLNSLLPSDVDRTRVHILDGSVQDPAFIDSALKDHKVTGVFLCLTGSDELFTTFNLLDCLRRSGTVKHVVYLSATFDFSLEAMQNGILKHINCAHVAVKFLVEAKLTHGLLPRHQEGGFSWTILGPTLFFDNDLRSKHAILKEGVFDAPVGSKGVSRVSEDDIALAAVKTLEDDGQQWGGKRIMIGSRRTYTAEEIAQLWSHALGRKIKHTPSDQESLDAFEQQHSKHVGPAWGRDLKLMYEGFEDIGPFGMTNEEYKEQLVLLGKEPESYEKYVERTAKQWLGQ